MSPLQLILGLILARLNAHTRGGVAPIGADARLAERANVAIRPPAKGPSFCAEARPHIPAEIKFRKPHRSSGEGSKNACFAQILQNVSVQRIFLLIEVPSVGATRRDRRGPRHGS